MANHACRAVLPVSTNRVMNYFALVCVTGMVQLFFPKYNCVNIRASACFHGHMGFRMTGLRYGPRRVATSHDPSNTRRARTHQQVHHHSSPIADAAGRKKRRRRRHRHGPRARAGPSSHSYISSPEALTLSRHRLYISTTTSVSPALPRRDVACPAEEESN